MSEKHVVYTEHAPEPIGPYSQAIRVGNLVFVSGQGSMDRAAGHMVRDSVEAETRQVLTNLKTILEAAGSSLDRVVKDRKSTRLNSSHSQQSRMPSSA
mgnify:CR=1 FL=1